MGEGQKILITPGMVELGEKQQELNRDFARKAAQVCDYIILVGKKHSLPLQQGLKDVDFPSERQAIAADLKEARQILANRVRPGDTVLFENDLPDTYTEARGQKSEARSQKPEIRSQKSEAVIRILGDTIYSIIYGITYAKNIIMILYTISYIVSLSVILYYDKKNSAGILLQSLIINR
jgi:hypothetical protein